jgi:hypothetical protein
MRSTRNVLALLLMASVSFGQRSAGGYGRSAGSIAVHPAPTRSVGNRVTPLTNRGAHPGATMFGHVGARRSFGSGFPYGRGYGLYAPYFPVSGYDFYPPYSPLYGGVQDSVGGYPEEYPVTGNVIIVQPGSGGTGAPAEAPPANPVIHEYKLDNEPAGTPGPQTTFTIVLKDGSTRSATASWIQGGRLHYLDLRSRQMLLSPEVIDRNATERANAAKSLRIDLPPG